MAARLNKTRLTAKPSVPGPLRAKHSIPRPSPLDQAKVAEGELIKTTNMDRWKCMDKMVDESFADGGFG